MMCHHYCKQINSDSENSPIRVKTTKKQDSGSMPSEGNSMSSLSKNEMDSDIKDIKELLLKFTEKVDRNEKALKALQASGYVHAFF